MSRTAAWLVTALAGVTPAPDAPELREGLEPSDVTPGVLGFIAIFAVVLACIPLFRSMTSKLRGVEYRARRDEDLRAQRDGDRGAPADPLRTSDGPTWSAQDDPGPDRPAPPPDVPSRG